MATTRDGRRPPMDWDGEGAIPVALAVLESDQHHIRDDVGDLRVDFASLRSDQRTVNERLDKKIGDLQTTAASLQGGLRVLAFLTGSGLLIQVLRWAMHH